MADTPTPAPPVRPLDELEWTPKDARWLGGGKRLHAVLAVVLIVLTFLPERVVEKGRAITNFYGDPIGRQASGIYWRWSEEETLEAGHERPAHEEPPWYELFVRWEISLSPAIAGVAVAVSLFLRGRARAVLVSIAGLWLALYLWFAPPFSTGWSTGLGLEALTWPDGDSVSYLDQLSSHRWADDHVLQQVLLCLGVVMRMRMRGRYGGGARSACWLLALLMLLLLALYFFSAMCAGTLSAWVYGQPSTSFDKLIMRAGDWVSLCCLFLERISLLCLAVFALLLAARGERRLAACGMAALGVALGAALTAQAADSAQVGYLIQTSYGGLPDRLLNGGEVIHWHLPELIGWILVIGGMSRLFSIRDTNAPVPFSSAVQTER